MNNQPILMQLLKYRAHPSILAIILYDCQFPSSHFSHFYKSTILKDIENLNMNKPL